MFFLFVFFFQRYCQLTIGGANIKHRVIYVGYILGEDARELYLAALGSREGVLEDFFKHEYKECGFR